MAYLGTSPSSDIYRMEKQTIVGDGNTVYALSYPVASEQEIEVFVNNVRQEPGVAYTTSYTTLTMTGSVAANDSFYVVYQGKANKTTIIPERETSGNYNFDSGTLYIDSGNNRVGVGTNTPNFNFEISGDSAAWWNSASGWNNNNLPTSLSITNRKNGGYDPVLIFHMTDSSGNSNHKSFAMGTVGTAAWTAGSPSTQISDLYIATRNASGGITERMRILSDGKVGIGITAPTSNLHVDGNTAITGDLKANSGYGSAATMYGVRAWVNFNGTGTVAIRGSGNVSGITDHGSGDYTVTFINAMPDTNYSFSFESDKFNQNYPRGINMFTAAHTASTIRIKQRYTNPLGSEVTEDTPNVSVIIVR